jgi:DNA (cytosine-5)-methyltransferase 1
LNAGGMGHIDYEIETLLAHALRADGFDASEDGTGRGSGVMPAVAFAENPRGELVTSDAVAATIGQRMRGQDDSCADNLQAVGPMAVRRLTPRECERLQGFPDDYTLIPYRGKPAADGPRYKALGNSMAVPVMHWIGKRLAFVDQIVKERVA